MLSVPKVIARVKRSAPYRFAGFLYKFVTDPDYRSVALLRLEKPNNLFQPYLNTWPDRYPPLFTFAREKLGLDPQARILSFGCSTGDEVFTLRQYLPQAFIKGVDINRRSIAMCRTQLDRSPDPKISFEVAGSTSGEETAYYDAIFCLAVLRHGDLATSGAISSKQIIPFANFDSMVTDFARCLKIGGFLFIAHSNFRFCDSPISRCFETAFSFAAPNADPRTPLYGIDNLLLHDQAYGDLAFRKVTNGESHGSEVSQTENGRGLSPRRHVSNILK